MSKRENRNSEDWIKRVEEGMLLTANAGYSAEKASEAVNYCLDGLKATSEMLKVVAEEMLRDMKKGKKIDLSLDQLAKSMKAMGNMIDDVTRLTAFTVGHGAEDGKGEGEIFKYLTDEEILQVQAWVARGKVKA